MTTPSSAPRAQIPARITMPSGASYNGKTRLHRDTAHMKSTTVRILGEIKSFRSHYRDEAKRWLLQLETAAKSAADKFTKSELYLIYAAYEITPWPAIQDAEPTDFPDGSSRCELPSESLSEEGLQHVLARCLEYFSELEADYRGVLTDEIFWALERDYEAGFGRSVNDIADRVYGLGADEVVGLVAMLEVVRAMPHGIRGFPGRWTPRSLLGMLERCDRCTPWRAEDSSEGACIDFDGDGSCGWWDLSEPYGSNPQDVDERHDDDPE